MRKIKIVSLFILFFITSCSNKIFTNPIGIESGNKYLSSKNLDSLKRNWNSILKQNKIKKDLSNFEIRHDLDSINRKDYYYIVGKSEDDSLKMATLLKLKNKTFFIKKDPYLIVICHGCPQAYPTYRFDKWGWGCESNDLSTDCLKTEIIN